MNAQFLERVGQALYGLKWQTDLARDLGVAARTVRHWHTTDAVPTGKRPNIVALCRRRVASIEQILQLMGPE